MNMQHSRRSILGRLAGAMASTPIAAAAFSPPPAKARQPLKGPITPDQYIEEMLAIGWEPYTIVQTLRSGKTIVLKGTFETFPSDYDPTDEQYLRRRQLLRAVGESGIDFYERTGARLFELGMIHYDD
jgi:hypothetical protein